MIVGAVEFQPLAEARRAGRGAGNGGDAVAAEGAVVAVGRRIAHRGAGPFVEAPGGDEAGLVAGARRVHVLLDVDRSAGDAPDADLVHFAVGEIVQAFVFEVGAQEDGVRVVARRDARRVRGDLETVDE
jgi:hypothetical protein